MKTLTLLLALAVNLSAPAQVYIRVKPMPGQTEAQARLAEYDRRLAAATDGLLARIARDRAARPELYAALTHYYLETLEGNPRSAGGAHAPSPRLEDMRPDLALFWCWLYLSPYRSDASRGYGRAYGVLRHIGGPDAVEAVRLQIEETLVAKEDPSLLALAQGSYFEDALALASSGGLKVVLDALPRVEAARLAAPRYDIPPDPFEELLRVMRSNLADERVQQALEDLAAATTDPARLALLARLKAAAVGRQEGTAP